MQFTKIISHIISTHQNNKVEHRPPNLQNLHLIFRQIPISPIRNLNIIQNNQTNDKLPLARTQNSYLKKKTIKQLRTKKTLKQPDKTFQQKKNYLRQHKQAQTQKKKNETFFPY